MTTLTSNIQCILAADPADLDQVYRLRYRCYRRKGSIPEREEESFSDAFDQKPNSFSFLLRSSNHEPMATVRINAAIQSRGWTDCPVQNVYGDHPVVGWRIGIRKIIDEVRPASRVTTLWF